MHEYGKEDIKNLNVRVESKYDIFTNEDDEICFAIAKVEGPQENPVLYYAGADHAVLVKNKLNMVVCDFIHIGVREILADAQDVIISEFEGSVEVTELGGYRADVNHSSDEFDKIKKLIGDRDEIKKLDKLAEKHKNDRLVSIEQRQDVLRQFWQSDEQEESDMSRMQLSAAAHNMQGAMLVKDGKYDDAVQEHMMAFSILSRLVDIAHAEIEPKYADSVMDLLSCYDWIGQYKEGADLLEGVLRVYEDLTLSESEYEANKAWFYAHIAYFYTKLEKYEEAEETGKTALHICRSNIEKDPQTYNEIYERSLYFMAELLHITKKYNEAEPIYHERIKLCEQLAAEQPDRFDAPLAVAINNLGSMYRAMGRYSDCEPLYDRALAMHRKLASENSGDDERINALASQLFRVGLLYELTDRNAQAKEAWEEAYGIWSGMDEKNIDEHYTDIFNQVKEKLGK